VCKAKASRVFAAAENRAAGGGAETEAGNEASEASDSQTDESISEAAGPPADSPAESGDIRSNTAVLASG
jgi:hypothetical protein